jgi:hypothetical protein
MAGLLGMFDPEVAQGFSVDPEERKRLLIANALLGVSGGLLGARKGQELQGLGYGMLQGAGMGQQAVSEASRDKYNQFRMMSEGQKMVDQRRAQAQAARDAQEVAGAFTGGAPDVSPLANGQGPTVANAAAQLPASPLGDQYRKAAQIYMRQNNPEKAKMAMEMAAKEDEEFSTTPQVGVGPDGPYNYVLGKRGTEKRLSAGVAPKFREVNTGGKVQVVNEYNLPSTGQSFDVTMNPFQTESLALDRSKFGYQQQRDRVQDAKTSEPAWVNDLERGIQIDPRTGQSRPIMAAGAPVGAKGESKKAESAESAQSIIDLAKPLIAQSTGSYAGNAIDKVLQVAGISTSGADANAQLAVLQARLMTEQPRMEGPQSDRDVDLYRKAAGEIGDPNIPPSRKLAALKTISALNDRYRKKQPVGATGGWSITEVK